ncbi:hypothetical protein PR048_004222 [Dryococelus australis]|uniref:DUF4371 domain-containing protein n=1 Tax=Dryococelus australis TaxID=614101 RepID=A0ABQ9I4W8_9NEOP|nr:hypothetical protein PR048_004222 [Dryococelus australis]
MIPFTHAEVVKERMLQSVKVMEGESTGISDIAQLSVFVQFFFNGERFVEELLGLIPLYGRTTGEILFNDISKLLASKSVSIAYIVSVVTDGAPTMARLAGKLKQINCCIIPYHCIIHNTVLCAKLSSKDSFLFLTEIAKQVNFLMLRSALTHKNLKQFLNDLYSEFKDVLLYNNVRWLSKGQTLKRVWGLREEVVLFLELMDTSEKRGHFINLLRDPNQLARFSFLVDILSYLNNLNLSLQVRLKLDMCDFSVQLSVNEIFKTFTDYINFWNELSKMNKFPYITEIEIKILTMFESTWI